MPALPHVGWNGLFPVPSRLCTSNRAAAVKSSRAVAGEAASVVTTVASTANDATIRTLFTTSSSPCRAPIGARGKWSGSHPHESIGSSLGIAPARAGDTRRCGDLSRPQRDHPGCAVGVRGDDAVPDDRVRQPVQRACTGASRPRGRRRCAAAGGGVPGRGAEDDRVHRVRIGGKQPGCSGRRPGRPPTRAGHDRDTGDGASIGARDLSGARPDPRAPRDRRWRGSPRRR